jgi:hypothetical protein
MTYKEATDLLPANAEWSSVFGNHGVGGCTEYFRTPDGQRFVIKNGDYTATAPFSWQFCIV